MLSPEKMSVCPSCSVLNHRVMFQARRFHTIINNNRDSEGAGEWEGGSEEQEVRKQVCLRTTAPYPGGGRRCPEEDLWHCAVVSSFSSSERGMCTSAPPTHLDDNSHQCHSSVRTATFIFEALIELHLYKMTRFFYTSMKLHNFHILAGSPLSRSTN